MEKRLYTAAVNGDVDVLRELLQEDALILDRVTLTCFNETPLHIAAMRGHKAFVIELLKHNSQLAMEVDSRKFSPLHVAAAKGYVEIAEALLEVKPDVCFARDRNGRNPLHVAAMKGKVEVLRVLFRKRPRAACERTNRDETILHLCVKYDQVEALKILVEGINDDDGNTILHLAVRDAQMETIKYLLNNSIMDLKEKNDQGDTALDILSQTTKRHVMDLEMSDTLREAGALRSEELPHSSSRRKDSTFSNHNSPSGRKTGRSKQHHNAGDWLAKKRDSIMVVASLIATMAFQAGVNPTGGVWQDDYLKDPQGKSVQDPHTAGESIMAHHHKKLYRYFIRANTIAFVSSLSTILLLISGLPFRRRMLMWVLMVIMWLTITSIALTYGISIVVLTPESQRRQLSKVIQLAVTVWCGVMSLLLLGNTLRLIGRWLKKKKGIEIWPWRRSRNSIDADDHGNGGQEALQTIKIASNNA